MKRLLLAGAVIAALVSAAPADAQTVLTRYVFVAVDAVEVYGSKLTITGVLEGESAARTVPVSFGSNMDQVAACERLALLAMTRPGEYRFEILVFSSTSSACKLARVTP